MTNLPVYSFVAYSGTGKTTFLEKLVPLLKAKGLRVAVIKHDGHDFEIDHEGKDSWRMAQAGADITGIVSATKCAVVCHRPPDMERLIDHITGVDLIITEGYKQGRYKKIALRRAANGKPFPFAPSECFAVISDTPIEESTPCFSFDDPEGVAALLEQDIR